MVSGGKLKREDGTAVDGSIIVMPPKEALLQPVRGPDVAEGAYFASPIAAYSPMLVAHAVGRSTTHTRARTCV